MPRSAAPCEDAAPVQFCGYCAERHMPLRTDVHEHIRQVGSVRVGICRNARAERRAPLPCLLQRCSPIGICANVHENNRQIGSMRIRVCHDGCPQRCATFARAPEYHCAVSVSRRALSSVIVYMRCPHAPPHEPDVHVPGRVTSGRVCQPDGRRSVLLWV